MEGVTTILSGEQSVGIGESQVIKRRMQSIAKDEEGDLAAISFLGEVDTEERTPSAARRECRLLPRKSIGVTGRAEKEGAKIQARQKLSVVRPLERSCTHRLCQSVEGVGSIYVGVVNRHPLHRVRTARVCSFSCASEKTSPTGSLALKTTGWLSISTCNA